MFQKSIAGLACSSGPSSLRRAAAATVVVVPLLLLSSSFFPMSVSAYTFPQLSPAPSDFNRSRCGDWKEFTLIFLHMHKCGGTSVEVSLRQFAWMCGIGYLRYPGPRRSWASMLRSGKVKILTGSNFYGIHRHLPPTRKYAYVTVFREPLPRLISQFQHSAPKLCHFNCSINEFSRLIGNYYVGRLMTGPQAANVVAKYTRQHSPRSFAMARNNLHKIDVVGDFSDLDHWLAAVQRMLRQRVGLDMELPGLSFMNVRNLETVAAINANASDVELLKPSLSISTVDKTGQYSEELLSQLRAVMKRDYEIWREAQALAMKHNATSSSVATADVKHHL